MLFWPQLCPKVVGTAGRAVPTHAQESTVLAPGRPSTPSSLLLSTGSQKNPQLAFSWGFTSEAGEPQLSQVLGEEGRTWVVGRWHLFAMLNTTLVLGMHGVLHGDRLLTGNPAE